MNRRTFLQQSTLATVGWMASGFVHGQSSTHSNQVPADWLPSWERSILQRARARYCDKELGEEIGWLVSPFLNGFLQGYLATGDPTWLDSLVDWADSWIKRGVKEPDGYLGWPKTGSGSQLEKSMLNDSLLGEAMGLQPLVMFAGEVQRTPGLQTKFGQKAKSYLELAEQTFRKWDSRSAWRKVENGGLWVVPPFGIDPATGEWTSEYSRKEEDGFSHPANKQNHIARWLLALYDVTAKPVYRERAEKWFRLMRSRMRLRDQDRFFVWNYWDPAGPWDYKPNGQPKHWVGVHPNGGYYQIDVEGLVAAFEHDLVISKADLERLIATNRDFMWNQEIDNAKFQRIDGGPADARWKDQPGVLWTALIPYDETLKKVFIANHDPGSWGGLSLTPWFLRQQKEGAEE
jgi:hypothetical protein